MVHALTWMREDAPYMPIAAIGLLAALGEAGATLGWNDGVLELDAAADIDAVATAILEAPLPDVSAVGWPTRNPQALGPALLKTDDPLATYRTLVRDAGPLERRLLRAIATDQVINEQVPARTRLLRGAKSDITAFAPLRRTTARELAEELADGPRFKPGKSGVGLGLVPEVQTFGGTTGREASSVGAESALLARLLRHGILELPPTGCLRRGRRREVGGPLVSDAGELSWPVWTVPCDRRSLRVLFGLACVHVDVPEPSALAAAGVGAVYRSAAHQLSTTVAVFRFGRRVA